MSSKVERPSAPDVNLRAVVFDIETMPNNFMAESEIDVLVCASFLPLDTGEVHTISLSHEDILRIDDVDFPAMLKLGEEL